MDYLQKFYMYLYYLDQLSDTEKQFCGGEKLVKSFNNFSDRRYFIEEINNIFNKMDLFKTPILLKKFYDNPFDIYPDFDVDLGIDTDTIDIHSEDFFENIRIMFEYIIKIDSLISSGEINDINKRLMLLSKMNIIIKNIVKLFVIFMNDDELMYKLLSKYEKI